MIEAVGPTQLPCPVSAVRRGGRRRDDGRGGAGAGSSGDPSFAVADAPSGALLSLPMPSTRSSPPSHPASPPRRTRRGPWVALAVVVALAIALAVPWRVNFLRGVIGEKVTQMTGRRFSVEGDLWWRWIPMRFSAGGMTFANPQWAGRPEMITVKEASARIAFWPLLKGRVELLNVRFVQPDLWLEIDGQGRRNWYLDRQQSDRESRVTIEEVELDQGRVTYAEPARQTQVVVQLSTLDAQAADAALRAARDAEDDVDAAAPRTGKAPAAAPAASSRGASAASAAASRGPASAGVAAGSVQGAVRVQEGRLQAQANGRWRGLPLTASALGDPVLQLRDPNQPYAFQINARVAETRVSAAGSVTRLTDPESADLHVAVSGPSVGQWYRIIGVGLPDTPPYRTEGRVRLSRGVWHYEDFTGRVGASDVRGNLAFEDRDPRPRLAGRLVSHQMRLRDLGPSFGAQAAASDSGAARPAAAASAPRTRVLPERRINAQKWDTLDADVWIEAQEVRDVGRLTLDDLRMHVLLQDGKLALDPASLGVAGGQVKGALRIDSGADPLAIRVNASFSRLKLDQLVPRVGDSQPAIGAITGKVQLAGRGNSYAQMLAAADGEAQLAMGRGRISNLLLELAGLDAAEALKFWVGGDRESDVRCALIDTQVERGVMRARTAIFDTSDTLVRLEGTVNLRDEALDLTVKPAPKDPSPLSLRVPIHVRGTLADPSVLPDRTGLLLRGGGAVLLGLVTPWAAWLPLIETGPGEDSDCGALLKRASEEGVKTVNAAPAASGAPRARGSAPASTKGSAQDSKQGSTKDSSKSPAPQPASGPRR